MNKATVKRLEITFTTSMWCESESVADVTRQYT